MFDDKRVKREEKIYLLNIYTNIFIKIKEEILKVSSPHSCNWSPNHSLYNYVLQLPIPYSLCPQQALELDMVLYLVG